MRARAEYTRDGSLEGSIFDCPLGETRATLAQNDVKQGRQLSPIVSLYLPFFPFAMFSRDTEKKGTKFFFRYFYLIFIIIPAHTCNGQKHQQSFFVYLDITLDVITVIFRFCQKSYVTQLWAVDYLQVQ